MKNLEQAIPVLRMEDPSLAEKFYCEMLGFTKRSLYFPIPGKDSPAYLSLEQDGAQVHLSSYTATTLASVYFNVRDIDTLFAELSARGVKCRAPIDQTWAKREIALSDPFGNKLTFGSPIDQERTQRAIERERESRDHTRRSS